MAALVLVDFWTYTCVNWLRTLPYVRAWASKYEDAGLTVVGVHTPQFGFEERPRQRGRADPEPGRRVPRRGRQRLSGVGRVANSFWPAVYIADAGWAGSGTTTSVRASTRRLRW